MTEFSRVQPHGEKVVTHPPPWSSFLLHRRCQFLRNARVELCGRNYDSLKTGP